MPMHFQTYRDAAIRNRQAAEARFSASILRTYFRCNDCTLAFAVEGDARRLDIRCGGCNGKATEMGAVNDNTNRLKSLSHRCACDARCTHALGPKCECECGGVNHGTGATVPVITINGVAVAQVADPDKCVANANEFRAKYDALKAEAEARVPHLADILARRWVADRDAWWKATEIINAIRKVAALKTHAGRIKAIAKLTARIGQ